MGTYRKRFNEKARAGHMAKLRELKRIRNKQFYREVEHNSGSDNEQAPERDSNAEILEPMTEEERTLKKRKLQELFTPKETKMSRLKKKRLDKFIEHQLKKEEKKEIIKKLQDYKIDTSMLTSLKKLGQGRQTRKEEFAEALSLEKQGRGDERTGDILYEEREVKEWGDEEPGSPSSDEDLSHDEAVSKSSFIDNRPAKFGGTGTGFGFANVKVINKDKTQSKKKYNWRQTLEAQRQKAKDEEDELDFMSSSEDESEDSEPQPEYGGGDVISGDSSEEEEEEDEEEEGAGTENENLKSVAEEFKTWADQEIKKIEGRDSIEQMPSIPKEYIVVDRPEDMDDGLPESNVPIDETSDRKAFYVKVERSEEIQASRMKLPIYGEEHAIMEAIHHNDIVIICGETGSGKTTQVPQFLYEAGFGCPDSPDYPGMVGITEPRRVAAVSMANRVSKELGDHGSSVAYQIRFDSTTKDDTKMKFMTDGVLLREMMADFRLTKYSAIIIDEAHERNINTDILIGMLSRCVKLRAKEHKLAPEKSKKLKLIIMSATLRVSDFSENKMLFSTPPPILNVVARQYPVSVHFNRRTPYNYAEEAFRKTCKIHRRLPPGAILVFMTGQQEIRHLVKRLRNEFPFRKGTNVAYTNAVEMKINSREVDLEAEDVDFSVQVMDSKRFEQEVAFELPDDEDLNSDAEGEEEEGFEETLTEDQTPNDPLYVLPLFSLLPTKEQMKVFESPPPGSRLCIVATNVAETSLTIPGVRYVVDCGRSKEKKYNEEDGVQSFEVGWISKASADQRSGRAGRVGPGHCYRLYSSAVYERDFDQFSSPEILRTPVESVVLQMKSMAIHNIVNFPFPTPPKREALAQAIKQLQFLGALDSKEKITDDGKVMSLFPLSPRFSKMLLVSNEHNCLPYVVSMVSALSVGDPFISEAELGLHQKVQSDDSDQEHDETSNNSEQNRRLRAKFYKSRSRFEKLDKFSDIFRVLSAVCAFDYVSPPEREKFLKDNFLRGKFMEEIVKLRKQLMYIVKSITSKENIAISVKDKDLLSPVPTGIQVKLLKQMVCAGFIDHVAVRADELFPEEAKITNRISLINIPYIPVLTQKKPNIEECFVYIHPTSMLNNAGELPPKFLVFNALHRSSSGKTRMDTLCDIKSTPLANIARKGMLLTYGKPLTGHGLKTIQLSPKERYCYVVPRFGSSVNSDITVGWDLNPIPVHQKLVNGQWIVDRFLNAKNYKALEKEKSVK